MSTLRVSRPAIDEAAAYYQTYIAEVGGDNIGEQLAEQLSQVERLFSRLDDATALSRYAPGKWSIKELLGHLNDAERIFSYRLLRISRGDSTPLPGFDQNPYVVAGALVRSKGLCEMPRCARPLFNREDGAPYLEVHHIIPLGENGDDILVNAAALCPHCHRELHFGRDRLKLRRALSTYVSSL